jgi:hypothetical protein
MHDALFVIFFAVVKIILDTMTEQGTVVGYLSTDRLAAWFPFYTIAT